MEERLLSFLREFYNLFQWPGVVVMMGLESAGIPIPSEAIMPLAGWMLVKEKGLGLAYLLLAAFWGALGNLLGSLLAYWIGEKGGRPLFRAYGRYLLLSPGDLDTAERFFQRHGTAAIFISRLLPVVRTYISFPAGMARMGLVRFGLYTIAGSFPWSLGLAYGGFLLGENWELIRQYMRPFDIPIAVGAVALIAWWFIHRLRRLSQKGS
jgi:membrane protein DedA with SNARE-associated domain